MRMAAALLIVAGLPACSSETSRAKDELTFLRENKGTPRQRCDAAARLSQAASKANDADQFQSAQRSEMMECTTVSTFPQYADIPGGMPGPVVNSDTEIEEEMALLNKDAQNSRPLTAESVMQTNLSSGQKTAVFWTFE